MEHKRTSVYLPGGQKKMCLLNNIIFFRYIFCVHSVVVLIPMIA